MKEKGTAVHAVRPLPLRLLASAHPQDRAYPSRDHAYPLGDHTDRDIPTPPPKDKFRFGGTPKPASLRLALPGKGGPTFPHGARGTPGLRPQTGTQSA